MAGFNYSKLIKNVNEMAGVGVSMLAWPDVYVVNFFFMSMRHTKIQRNFFKNIIYFDEKKINTAIDLD